MKATVQILGTGAGGLAPCVAINTETQRYIFNAGGGLQRFCIEHKVRLSRLSSLLLTRLDSSTVEGLPGLILTLTDLGKKSFSLTGPPGLLHFLHATRYFLRRDDFKGRVYEIYKDNLEIKDKELTVRPIVIFGETIRQVKQSALTTTKDEMSTCCQGAPATKKLRKNTACCDSSVQLSGDNYHPVWDYHYIPDSSLGALPFYQHRRATISYICQTSNIPGKFLVQKAKELGIPKGPLYGQLTRGKSVTLESGRVICPSDVIEPEIPGPFIGVIDCPSLEALNQLANNSQILKFTTERKPDDPIMSVCVHLAPAAITTNSAYGDWLKSFGTSTQHIMANSEDSSAKSPFRASTSLLHRLHGIAPNIFPVPYGEIAVPKKNSRQWTARNIVEGRNLLEFTVIPRAKQGISSPMQDDETQSSETAVEAALEAVNTLCEDDIAPLRVLFLGTGSAIPSKYRNVSGMLLHFRKTVDDQSLILLDPGEGSYGQLTRRFGPQVVEIINKLDGVWISHMHADHHPGLITILAKRDPNSSPLFVIGPKPLNAWLMEYGNLDPTVQGKYHFIENEILSIDSVSKSGLSEDQEHSEALEHDTTAVMKAQLLARLKMKSVRVVPVDHCYQSYGVVLAHQNGELVVYSGDCRPSEALVMAGKGATLLIHEATFEDGMELEAQRKRHTTVSEALGVAEAMLAQRLLLTHFSQRYPKVSPLSQDAKRPTKVFVAADLMSISTHDLDFLPSNLLQDIQALFEEDEDQNSRTEVTAT